MKPVISIGDADRSTALVRAPPSLGWSGLLLLLGLSGCGAQTESERSYFAAREAERLQQQELRNAVVSIVPDKEILALVYSNAAPDGVGTTEDWVERMALNHDGQLLFPRWHVTRRGANRYEVKYTFTRIDVTNNLTRGGFSWNVDAALKLVDPPNALTIAEPIRKGRSFTQQQEHRIRDEEASLE